MSSASHETAAHVQSEKWRCPVRCGSWIELLFGQSPEEGLSYVHNIWKLEQKEWLNCTELVNIYQWETHLHDNSAVENINLLIHIDTKRFQYSFSAVQIHRYLLRFSCLLLSTTNIHGLVIFIFSFKKCNCNINTEYQHFFKVLPKLGIPVSWQDYIMVHKNVKQNISLTMSKLI